MDFPLVDLVDHDRSCIWLRQHFHPEGLRCPRCETSWREAYRFRRTKRIPTAVGTGVAGSAPAGASPHRRGAPVSTRPPVHLHPRNGLHRRMERVGPGRARPTGRSPRRWQMDALAAMETAYARCTLTPLRAPGDAAQFFASLPGVHKKHLAGYVAICEFTTNLKRVTPSFISALVRVHDF